MIRSGNPANRPLRQAVSRSAAGFVAGFLSVLIFHQSFLAVLHAIGMAPFAPFQMHPTAPFGVPQIVSLAFWGGIWGIGFAWIERYLPRGWRYFLSALLIGAVLPTLVAWFVVAPLKGLPIAGGSRAALIATGLIVNGAWGIGTAIILRLRPA
jgi:uncharacterized BrkB/YihY/UPF0761 family membrane protein